MIGIVYYTAGDKTPVVLGGTVILVCAAPFPHLGAAMERSAVHTYPSACGDGAFDT